MRGDESHRYINEGRIEWDEWKSSIETYILLCVRWIATGNFLCDAGSLNPLLCDCLKGWDGVEVGKEVQETEDICMSVADSC